MAKNKNYLKGELPHNDDAEKVVLGAAMQKEDALYNVTSSLQEEDFYTYKHKYIFNAIINLLERKMAVDVLTVSSELENMKQLESVGSIEYLQELCETVVSFANLQFYIDIVVDQSVLRKMLSTIRDIDNKFKTGGIENVNDFILESETLFKESIARRHISSFTDLNEATKVIETQLNNQKELPASDVVGLSSGYTQIDALTQGFQKGEVTIVAARPSVGKTALSLNFAYNVASVSKVPVALFSLEMSTDSLVKRLIAMVSCVNLKSINTGHFSGGDRAKVSHAIKELRDVPIFIDETPGIKVIDLIAKARKLQAAHPDLGLIVIDYLGLVQYGVGKSSSDNRVEEIRKISGAIKGLAKDLKVPVVVVSQLSRGPEKRDVKRPMLSDLRDSGDIEQDADVVMLLYRPDYYKDQKKNNAANKKGGQLTTSDKFELAKERLGDAIPGSASYVEVNVAKNRNGSTGKVDLFFFKEYGRFDPPSENWVEEMNKIRTDDGD